MENEPIKSNKARVVLLDTNAFGRGVLARKDIADVSRLLETGIKVVVPDVVCHELAAHAIATLSEVRFDVLEVAGFAEIQSLRVAMDERVRFHTGVAAALERIGCEIQESVSSWWMGAVLDQIYVGPPAFKKGDVKTGAQDSAISRHALKLRQVYGEVLVVSSDKLLAGYLSTRGISSATSIQDAIGSVARNASAETLRKVLQSMWIGQRWSSAFADLAQTFFNSSSVATIDMLGVTNLVVGNNQLYGSFIFSIQELVGDASETGLYSRGRLLYSAEVEIETDSLLPVRVRSVDEISQQIDYSSYPMPVDPQSYLTIEKSCISRPQVDIAFDLTHRESLGVRYVEVGVRLDGEMLANVEMSSYDVLRDSQYGSYIDKYGDVVVGGPISIVQAKWPVTHAGYLGSRIMKRWAGLKG